MIQFCTTLHIWNWSYEQNYVLSATPATSCVNMHFLRSRQNTQASHSHTGVTTTLRLNPMRVHAHTLAGYSVSRPIMLCVRRTHNEYPSSHPHFNRLSLRQFVYTSHDRRKEDSSHDTMTSSSASCANEL